MQVKNLLNVIIINFEPALRKPVLVRKFLFHLFWHSVAIQACFCKVAGQNRKKLLPDIFLSYQKKKKISAMDVFIILQLRLKWFSRAKGGKEQHYKKRKHIRYFNVINITEC